MSEPIPQDTPRSLSARLFPLDDASNLDINVTVGSIFSVLEGPPDPAGPAGRFYRARPAGSAPPVFALHGSCSMLVRHRRQRHPRLHPRPRDRRVHVDASEHANPRGDARVRDRRSNERFWEEPVRHYVAECVAGQGRRPRRRIRHALGRLDGRRRAAHAHPRRHFIYPAPSENDAERGVCDCLRSQPDGDDRRAGRRRRRAPGASASSTSYRRACRSACR